MTRPAARDLLSTLGLDGLVTQNRDYNMYNYDILYKTCDYVYIYLVLFHLLNDLLPINKSICTISLTLLCTQGKKNRERRNLLNTRDIDLTKETGEE